MIMNNNYRTLILASLLLFTTFTVTFAQSGIDALAVESLAKNAVEQYKRGDYNQALQILEELHKIRFEYQSNKVVHFMLGKTLYKLKKYKRAKSIQKDFLLNYPYDILADFVRHNLGEIYYRLGEYPKAMREFLTVAVVAKNAPLRSKGLTLAGHILESKVTLDDMRKQRNQTVNIIEKAFLTLKLSENLYMRGAGDLAKAEARDFLSEYKNPPFKEEIKRISKGKFYERDGSVTIGVLLPLTGEHSENGLNILRGIKTAYDEQPEEVRKNIKLTIIDNESDQVKTVRSMIRFAEDPSILTVIGPMISENATAAAAVANSYGLPMISPTATKEGISGLGSYSFQANSDLTVRGRALATFAVDSLGLKRIAILSPADKYGKEMTDSFAYEFDKLGGEIVAQSWYYGVPEDLRLQFSQFRRIGFRLKEELFPTETPPDSADILADSTLADSLIMVMLAELSRPPKEVDSSKIILDVIDGFYLPIQFGEIKYIAPQFAFWNFKTQILGGQNWYDEELLNDRDISRYLDGTILSSDIYRGSGNEELSAFQTKYNELYGEEPYRTDIFGYDCLTLVLDIVNQKVSTRNRFIEKLNSVSDYKGVAGSIDFTGESKRVNDFIHILKFENKTIEKIN